MSKKNEQGTPAPKRPRAMGLAWGLTAAAIAAAIGSYYTPGPLQLVSFAFVGCAIVCLIIARRDELRDHHELIVALRLEADLAMNLADDWARQALMWRGLAFTAAEAIRAQSEAIHERDESAHEVLKRWADTVRPTTAANKARAWMDDRSVYSTMAAVTFAERSEDEK